MVAAIAAGRPVGIVDDADRENGGDLIIAAKAATPELARLRGPVHERRWRPRCREGEQFTRPGHVFALRARDGGCWSAPAMQSQLSTLLNWPGSGRAERSARS
ncbi:3,4-dihydroxy-2-butanone-4-phosphate synthase [Streptomyces sp. NPDC096153]|uniref:3,4-dihydroxy-2-butanone-4-phosphate synthase n=1 Tax=Streptomyces sp. NPDC096153 TaxID=3155548 RepID=UPI00331A137C